MKPAVLKQNLDQEFYTEERCFITEISNSDQDPDLSIAWARVVPGETTQWHRLEKTVERYCIIQGQAIVEIGDKDAEEVTPGDVVIIPPMCRQRITNTGDQDLIFLAICTPRFSPAVYEHIDEEKKQTGT